MSNQKNKEKEVHQLGLILDEFKDKKIVITDNTDPNKIKVIYDNREEKNVRRQ